jgi:hypothetical protein
LLSRCLGQVLYMYTLSAALSLSIARSMLCNRPCCLAACLQVVRDELVRTSAVASRVAASEAGRSGLVDEGMVPLSQHLDEVRYSQGEAARLKERVAQLERELQVGREGCRGGAAGPRAGGCSCLGEAMAVLCC